MATAKKVTIGSIWWTVLYPGCTQKSASDLRERLVRCAVVKARGAGPSAQLRQDYDVKVFNGTPIESEATFIRSADRLLTEEEAIALRLQGLYSTQIQP